MAPGDFEQFVIMGESMGGIIGRYALAYMEDSRYEAKNTDLFFSDANDPNNKFYLRHAPGNIQAIVVMASRREP